MWYIYSSMCGHNHIYMPSFLVHIFVQVHDDHYVPVPCVTSKISPTPHAGSIPRLRLLGRSQTINMECIISPEDIAAKVGLRAELLDLSCEENCFVSLSDFVDPWRLVFADLLSSLDLKDIDTENRGASEQEKRVASLRKWKSRNGADATYRVIIQSAIKCGHVDNAEAICRQLLSQASRLEG